MVKFHLYGQFEKQQLQIECDQLFNCAAAALTSTKFQIYRGAILGFAGLH